MEARAWELRFTGPLISCRECGEDAEVAYNYLNKGTQRNRQAYYCRDCAEALGIKIGQNPSD